MYSKSIRVKQFSLNEAVSFVTISGSLALSTQNTPSPATSLMLFRNGQLLTQGPDYSISSATITIGTAEPDDIFLATYSY
jgi:hypothetical protein